MSVRTLSEECLVAWDPSAVYVAVSDLARMASWSDEYLGSWRTWRRERPGRPRSGDRFVGWNRNGWRIWFTTCPDNLQG
jgi:hypothetical protein